MIQPASLLILYHLTILSRLQHRGRNRICSVHLSLGRKLRIPMNKTSNKLSAVGVVEELFEEGSAMLAERLGKDFPLNSSGLFRCAVCQVDQPPSDGLSVNSGPFFSPSSKPWEGPFLCSNCRRKKDAMEGKRPTRATVMT
ncbi:hypothetical protein Patl1_22306 [Pistacia atlantica]|uniref:Uncharacterized protein n=1 Tax=Pistacia atlantica TaxID=434234 RepID=A0ACC0ZY22_9ROSI|nr:hypothetical protein Patl1_22306 [Pistacia atlantica]